MIIGFYGLPLDNFPSTKAVAALKASVVFPNFEKPWSLTLDYQKKKKKKKN